MEKLSQFLTVKDAAAYLGVAENTLRNWGRAGKINERRHPINHYRLYSTTELEKLLGKVNISASGHRPKRKPK
ncbi:MAG TPA: helix-turn-helix domain-containing protein [Pirellulales bacterium]|jgi:excisionase family DNA binding protein|nr:helix-turn-helix domain-containing protein [Pirellulales bacterium]